MHSVYLLWFQQPHQQKVMVMIALLYSQGCSSLKHFLQWEKLLPVLRGGDQNCEYLKKCTTFYGNVGGAFGIWLHSCDCYCAKTVLYSTCNKTNHCGEVMITFCLPLAPIAFSCHWRYWTTCLYALIGESHNLAPYEQPSNKTSYKYKLLFLLPLRGGFTIWWLTGAWRRQEPIHLNQVPQDQQLYIPSEWCGVNLKHLQYIPPHFLGRAE